MNYYHSFIARACQFLVILVFVPEMPAAIAQNVLTDGTGLKWKLESRFGLKGEFPEYYSPALDLKSTYYYEPFERPDGPYAEYDFLNPARTISIRTLIEEAKADDKVRGYHLSLDASYLRMDHLFRPRVHFSNFGGTHTFGLGMNYAYLMADSTRVIGGINLNHEQLASGEVLASKANIGYKKLWQYNSGRAFASELEFEFTNSENESRHFSISKFSTGFDYYFGKRWSLGLDLDHSMSNLKRFESYGVGASTKYYFGPKFGVDFGIGIIGREDKSLGIDAKLSAEIRF